MSRVRLKIAACPLRSALMTSNRADQLLQLAVVRLDDIIQVLDLAMLCFLWAFAFPLQLGNRRRVGRRLIGVDDQGLLPSLEPGQRFGQKALGGLGVPRR